METVFLLNQTLKFQGFYLTMSDRSNSLELIVWHFVRREYEDRWNRSNVPMALKYLIKAFSNKIIGSKRMTIKEDLDFVQLLRTSKLPNIARFKLLFRASENDFSATMFHQKCNDKQPTLTIIESNHGHIFGGYTKGKWE